MKIHSSTKISVAALALLALLTGCAGGPDEGPSTLPGDSDTSQGAGSEADRDQVATAIETYMLGIFTQADVSKINAIEDPATLSIDEIKDIYSADFVAALHDENLDDDQKLAFWQNLLYASAVGQMVPADQLNFEFDQSRVVFDGDTASAPSDAFTLTVADQAQTGNADAEIPFIKHNDVWKILVDQLEL